MTAYFVVLIIGAITLAIFLSLRIKKKSIPAVIAKSVVSTLFIAAALVCAYSNLTEGFSEGKLRFICLVIMGLLSGLLGDIWLDLKFCYRKDDGIFTYAGFISFAIGHIFYLLAVILTFGFKFKFFLPALAAGLIGGAVTFFGGRIMKLKYGAFRLIASAYVFIMCTAVFYSVSICFFGSHEKSVLLMAIGGIFFILSDFVLSATYFGEGKDRPIDIASNHILYYIAQYAIAASLLFAV